MIILEQGTPKNDKKEHGAEINFVKVALTKKEILEQEEGAQKNEKRSKGQKMKK